MFIGVGTKVMRRYVDICVENFVRIFNPPFDFLTCVPWNAWIELLLLNWLDNSRRQLFSLVL